MEEKINTLTPFFEDPLGKFSIRALARMINMNHTTVRQNLLRLEKEGYLASSREGVYVFFHLLMNNKTRYLKIHYNLEKLRRSCLLDDMIRSFDQPTIVLFGSFAQALDDKDSDIDLCLLTNINKRFELNKYEKLMNRKISLYQFDDTRWNRMKNDNPGLINSICNGIVLSGQLEVL